MTTLYASLIRLHALRDGCIPQTQGRFALAAFLDIVHQVDPALAVALHDSKNRRPFTLSQLRGLPVPRQGEVRLRAGHECWLRVTLTGETLFGTFIRRFLQGEARPTLRLGEMPFGVSEVLTTPGSHPWAGYTTAEELLNCARDDDTIALEFASPFGFSLGDNRVEIAPRPELLFGGLHKKWAQWCARPLAPGERSSLAGVTPPAAQSRLSEVHRRGLAELPDEPWLREHVLIKAWRVQSRMLRYGPQAQVGSEGNVVFRIFNADAKARRMLNALADFAFYAGIGRKTTQGMGQVRRVDRWTPPTDAESDSGLA